MLIELRDGVLHTDGAPGLLATADYPYYRDDPSVWRERLRTLRDATGIRVVTSYFPWRHHQPEADLPPDFTGATRPDRDLLGYLRICAELGLGVIAKPGPFIHAETNYGGLPDWICPLTNAQVEPSLDADGRPVLWNGSRHDPDGGIERWPLPSPVGAHFGARVGEWLRAVGKEVLSATTTPEGPVVLVQIANEGLFTDGALPLWAYDYSEPGLTFFRAGLHRRYGSLDAYNAVHGTAHREWSAVEPPRERGVPADARAELALADWGRYHSDLLAEAYHGWTEALGPAVPVLVNLNPPAGEAHAFDAWLSRVRPERWNGIHYGFTNWMGVVSSDRTAHARYVLAAKRAPGPNLEENWGFSELYDRAYAAGATSFHQSLLALAVGATGINVYTGVATSGWGDDLDLMHSAPYPDCPPVDAQGRPTDKAATVRMLSDFFAVHGAEYLAALPATQASWGLYAPYAAIAAWLPDVVADDPSGTGCGRPLRALHERLRDAGQDYRVVDLESATPEQLAGHPRIVLHGGRFMHRAVQQLLAAHIMAGHTVELSGPVPLLDEELTPCALLADALAQQARQECTLASPVRVTAGSADAYWRSAGPDSGYLTVLVQSDNEGPVAVELDLGSRSARVTLTVAAGGAALLRILAGTLDDFLLTGLNAYLASAVTPSVGFALTTDTDTAVDAADTAAVADVAARTVRAEGPADLARIGGILRTLTP
ncbi:beta-galactosidase [Streptacidiphilus sp. EB129]|uniref:beta-galactosidase n=1 Tax=Streptacidiphilus sp. EB129 TaxID=3156262 RepID=UPI003516B5F8